jgi:hypothetical protein
MAAGTLPKPGAKDYERTELLCVDDCKHTDCNYLKTMTKSLCKICQTPIGYDTRYYREDDKQLVHARCVEG